MDVFELWIQAKKGCVGRFQVFPATLLKTNYFHSISFCPLISIPSLFPAFFNRTHLIHGVTHLGSLTSRPSRVQESASTPWLAVIDGSRVVSVYLLPLLAFEPGLLCRFAGALVARGLCEEGTQYRQACTNQADRGFGNCPDEAIHLVICRVFGLAGEGLVEVEDELTGRIGRSSTTGFETVYPNETDDDNSET